MASSLLLERLLKRIPEFERVIVNYKIPPPSMWTNQSCILWKANHYVVLHLDKTGHCRMFDPLPPNLTSLKTFSPLLAKFARRHKLKFSPHFLGWQETRYDDQSCGYHCAAFLVERHLNRIRPPQSEADHFKTSLTSLVHYLETVHKSLLRSSFDKI